MRVAITGAAGLLGRELVRVLAEHRHTVIAGVHKTSARWSDAVRCLTLDLTDEVSIRQFVSEARVDCLVHSAAMTHVDGCETEPAVAELLNAAATAHLVDAIDGAATRIIYISTDFVFGGEKGPYREDDPPNAINVYGRTKLAGEEAIRRADSRHAIVRSAGFLGIGDSDRPTFVESMLTTMTDNPPLRAALDQCSNITPVDYFAAVITEIAERRLGGIWHVAGREIISRYELARRLADLFGLPESVVEGVAYDSLGRPARRPLQGGLITDKAEAGLTIRAPSLEESLAAWKAARQP